MFLGGRNYRNKVRTMKTHAEFPKEIKANNKTFYSHRYKKIRKKVEPQCTEDMARTSDGMHMVPKSN